MLPLPILDVRVSYSFKTKNKTKQNIFSVYGVFKIYIFCIFLICQFSYLKNWLCCILFLDFIILNREECHLSLLFIFLLYCLFLRENGNIRDP